MGYESTLYVVKKSTMRSLPSEGEARLLWAEEIAKIKLCKMDYNGPFSLAIDKMRTTDCYIYSDDGDTRIIEDRYGEPLKEMNIAPMIRILKKEDQDYRRIPPAIALLEAFDEEAWGKLTVLHYGY